MLGKHTLNPDEKTELKAVFETAGRPGVFRKIVTLSTDIPGQDEIEALVMMGTVKEKPSAKIQVDPRKMVLEGVEPGVVRPQTFSVKNTGSVPLIITKIFVQDSNTLYFDGAKEGNLVIEPDMIKKIDLQLRVESGEKQSEQLIVIVSNARNAANGNYIIMIQFPRK
jgi:hypothetical protein